MVDKVRAKFRCCEIKNYGGTNTIYVFSAVSDQSTPENERFTRYTPSGKLELSVDNPAIDGFYEVGEFYYLDMTKAPA